MSAGFTLPLDREAFRLALQSGQGRALMHVREHGAAGIEDLIVEACVTCQSYDPQCEDNRARWLTELIKAGDLQSEVRSTIITALRSDPKSASFWDVLQQCRLAWWYAEDGDKEAREALYAAFRKNDTTADIIAGEEIVALDGVDGLIHVVSAIGKLIADKPGLHANEDPLIWYDSWHGDGTARFVLESAADSNPQIAAYLHRLDNKPNSEPSETYRTIDIRRFSTLGQNRIDSGEQATVEEIIQSVESLRGSITPYSLRRWGRRTNGDNLRIIATRLFEETDPIRLYHYLSIVEGQALPEFDTRLFEVSKHVDRRVRWRACRVISNYTHPVIREFALSMVESGSIKYGGLRLLRNHLRDGDWRRIAEAIPIDADREATHAIMSDILDVYESNPDSADLQSALVEVYEHSPCSLCRSSAANILHIQDMIPAWVLKECQHDCDEGTREFANEASNENS